MTVQAAAARRRRLAAAALALARSRHPARRRPARRWTRDCTLRALDLRAQQRRPGAVARRLPDRLPRPGGPGRPAAAAAPPMRACASTTARCTRPTSSRMRWRIDDPRGASASTGSTAMCVFSACRSQLDSELRWRGGALHGLAFGAARLPFAATTACCACARPVTVPMLGGHAAIDHLQLRPPAAGQGLEIRFGLELERLDVAQLSHGAGLAGVHRRAQRSHPRGALRRRSPRFRRRAVDAIVRRHGAGVVAGDGASVRRRADAVVRHRLRRPRPGSADRRARFRHASPASSTVASTTCAWSTGSRSRSTPSCTPTRRRASAGVRQRISQRAVQDLSSVGDASFVTSLQSQLIGLFDDFGYRRIGIACRLSRRGLRNGWAGFSRPGFHYRRRFGPAAADAWSASTAASTGRRWSSAWTRPAGRRQAGLRVSVSDTLSIHAQCNCAASPTPHHRRTTCAVGWGCRSPP